MIRVFLYVSLLIGLISSCKPDQQPGEQLVSKEDSLAVYESLTPQIADLSRKIKANPANHQLFFVRANAYQNFGNLKLATSDYERAFQLDSNEASYTIALADIYFQLGNSQESIALLEKYHAYQPEEKDVLNKLSRYYLITRRYNKSLDYLNEILKLDIQNAEAYFLKGINFKELGDTERAISNFQTTVEIEPENLEAFMQLAIMHHDLKDEIAVRYYNNALMLNDSSREALYGKAKYFQDVERYEEAIEMYKRLINIDPQNSNGMYNIATIYYGLDSIERAFRFFNLTTRIDPIRASAYYGKGLCAEEMGNIDEAVTFYQQALNLDARLEEASEKLNLLSKDNAD